MTVAVLMDTLKNRGLMVVLGSDGQPRVVGPKENITPALINALKAFREEFIRQLAPPKPPACRVFLWRDGHLYRQTQEEFGVWPVGAWWWKTEGEASWRLVPGRENHARGHDPPRINDAR